MKPFDPTRPVQTRDGSPARIIVSDRKGGKRPILALIDIEGQELVQTYTTGGRVSSIREETHNLDLVNIPQTKKVWVNIYEEGGSEDNLGWCAFHDSKGEAEDEACLGRVACVEIEVEVDG